MKSLHKRINASDNLNEPSEGERTLLCSNRCSPRSPSLDFLDTSAEGVSDDMILDYLARIISKIYLKQYHGYPNTEEGSDILPGINKRAG